jgi:hypothetical protein
VFLLECKMLRCLKHQRLQTRCAFKQNTNGLLVIVQGCESSNWARLQVVSESSKAETSKVCDPAERAEMSAITTVLLKHRRLLKQLISAHRARQHVAEDFIILGSMHKLGEYLTAALTHSWFIYPQAKIVICGLVPCL